MNLNNARILIAAQYSAPYEGNFIASLKNLHKHLSTEFDAVCAYVFPRAMSSQPWAADFIASNEVYLTGSLWGLITNEEADNIVSRFNPSIIYTHFEGYDKPFADAVARSRKPIQQVWHMHDTLLFHPNIVKAIYQVWSYFRHYGQPMLPPPLVI